MSKYKTIARTGEIPPGEMRAVEVDGIRVLLCNVDGEFFAVHDECTHECFPLSEGKLTGGSVTCMLHGASFDVKTGEVLALPAYEPLTTYRVRVDGEDISIALE